MNVRGLGEPTILARVFVGLLGASFALMLAALLLKGTAISGVLLTTGIVIGSLAALGYVFLMVMGAVSELGWKGCVLALLVALLGLGVLVVIASSPFAPPLIKAMKTVGHAIYAIVNMDFLTTVYIIGGIAAVGALAIGVSRVIHIIIEARDKHVVPPD